MRRIVIIAVLVLVVLAFILGPLLRGGSSDNSIGATFTLTENYSTMFGKVLPLEINVPDGVEKVELIYNDQVVQKWSQPEESIKYDLKADFFGVGTRNMTVRSYFSNGNSFDDSRLLRVLSDISPEPLKTEVVASFPHNKLNYTQGLEFDGDVLFEGTGNPQFNGESTVGKIDIKTGAHTTKNALDATYFGEGITLFGDELYQLTWKNGKCFVYDKSTMQLKRDITYSGEGWGLCNDGKYLIMSDGTERITFRDPVTFSPVKTIEVYDNMGPITQLNELEYIDGKIYANVYTTNFIVVIEAKTGKVLQQIDASSLAAVGQMGGEVLNGIAYNRNSKKLFMTGKNWGKLMEVKLVKP